ncbi:MAG: hypothetical protein V4529_11880 [Gemmatimonadota bacterium]
MLKPYVALPPGSGGVGAPCPATPTSSDIGTIVPLALLVSVYGDVAVSVAVAFPLLAGFVVKRTSAVIVPLGATDPVGEATEHVSATTLLQIAVRLYVAAVLPVFLIVKYGKPVLTFCCVHSVGWVVVTDGCALGSVTVTEPST